jgi:hypothetical protein
MTGYVERIDPMRTILRTDTCLPVMIPNKVSQIRSYESALAPHKTVKSSSSSDCSDQGTLETRPQCTFYHGKVNLKMRTADVLTTRTANIMFIPQAIVQRHPGVRDCCKCDGPVRETYISSNLRQKKGFVQSKIDERDSLKRERPMSGKSPVRSGSFHRQNVQRSAGSYSKRELQACFFPPAHRSSARVQ